MACAITPAKQPSKYSPLLVAAALSLLALLVRWSIDPFIGDKHQFVPAYAAIAVATWRAGWRAGALTALASLAAGELFDSVTYLDSTPRHIAMAYMAYIGTSALVISMAEWLQRERQEAAAGAVELREAAQRKSDFMALLGHELRTPLATIAMGGKLLRAGGLDPLAAQGTLDMLLRQTERMNKLIGDLMDVKRIQTGKLSLAPEVVDLFVSVQTAIQDAMADASAKRQRITLLQPQPVGRIYADPLRLHQILINLIHNASKFSPEGGEIEITLAGRVHSVEIVVKDSGIGIAPSELHRIFEPFVQLESNGEESHGLGLGLPLTRELVQLHGGTVRAFSAGPGRGAEFLVVLPRALPHAPDGEPQEQGTTEPAVTGGEAPRQAARRVLVVDDSEDAAATLALLLRLKGHVAFTAGDGRQALAVAARERPDLVFLDLGLPDMHGLELARQLRGLLPRRPTLVALTGWGSQDDRKHSYAAGCDAHLTKPVPPEEIDRALSLFADGASLPAERCAAAPDLSSSCQ